MSTISSVIATITSTIVANGNNEITADVLRPVLIEIAQFVEDKGGSFDDLSTTDTDSLVAAINELKSNINEIAAAGLDLFAGSFPTYADLVAAVPVGSAGQYAFLLQDDELNDGFFEYRWNLDAEEWQKETSTATGSILMKVSGSDFEGGTALKFVWDKLHFIVSELVGGGIDIQINIDTIKFDRHSSGDQTGSIDLDWSKVESFKWECVGHTTVTDINLPGPGQSKTLIGFVTGDGFDFINSWGLTGDTYDGSVVNRIALFYDGDSEEFNGTLENLS